MENREPTPLEPGQHVICTFRMPPTLQPWAHEVYVGVIEEPGDSKEWNGSNSERYFCEKIKASRVRYGFGVALDPTASLIPITPEEAKLSFRAKIKRFMSPESLAIYDKCSLQLDIPEEERI